MGLQAHGAFSNLWIHKTYRRIQSKHDWYHHCGHIVTKYYRPYNPQTSNQQFNRQLLANAVYNWQYFSQTQRDPYNYFARHLPLLGYNRYISLYLQANKNMIIYWDDLQKNSSDSIKIVDYIASPYFKTDFLDGIGVGGGNVCADIIQGNDKIMTGEMKWYFVSPMEFGVYLKSNTKALVFGNIQYRLWGNQTALQLGLLSNNEYIPDNTHAGWSSIWIAQDVVSAGAINFTHVIQLYAGANLVKLLALREDQTQQAWIIGNDRISTFGYMLLNN